MMNFPKYLNALLLDGNVVIGPYDAIEDVEIEDAKRILTEFELDYRLEAPAGVPLFSVDWALWAALKFYRTCQFALYREIDQQTVDAEFSRMGISPPDHSNAHDPTAHYSVDIVFRFLKDLLKLTTTLSREDPLVAHVEVEALRWPISSTGIATIYCNPAKEIFDHLPLRQMYIDRIIQTKDKSRIDSPNTRDLVRMALGEQDAWSQELARINFTNI